MPKPTRFNMSSASHRALAIKWALLGFAASGKGFHGEVYDREKYPAVEGMLLVHFDRLYDQERGIEDFDSGDTTRIPRVVTRDLKGR
jgi:hypothetical protein